MVQCIRFQAIIDNSNDVRDYIYTLKQERRDAEPGCCNTTERKLVKRFLSQNIAYRLHLNARKASRLNTIATCNLIDNCQIAIDINQ